MNLGTKSSYTSTQSLLGLTALLLGSTSRTRMGANHGAVQQQPFHIRFFYQLLMQLVPHIFVRPSAKAFENRIPFT
jgi:hypothetical protein